MPPRERLVDRGRRRGRRLRHEAGLELREARIAAGLTQERLAATAGIPRSEVSRIEAGIRASVSIERLAVLFAVLGMELVVRAYPSGPPLRDAAHVALLGRLRSCAGSGWRWRTEVPVDIAGDPRAWDAQLVGRVRIGVEAETRLRDLQALQRRIEAKRRDSHVDRVVLVLADTRSNRTALGAAGDAYVASYPVGSVAALAALASGLDPGGDAIVLLRGDALPRAGRAATGRLVPGGAPSVDAAPGRGTVGRMKRGGEPTVDTAPDT